MKRSYRNILVEFLISHKLSIAFAESMTCGLLSHNLSTVKGISEVLRGGIVCYDERVKKDLFNISSRIIKKHTAESQYVTDLLAIKLKSLITSDISAAITGLASPGGSETKNKPVGTVFFTFIYGKNKYNQKKLFRGKPLEIRKRACEEFYKFIYRQLKIRLLDN
jgi:nicotinamide-nucleotide amidase